MIILFLGTGFIIVAFLLIEIILYLISSYKSYNQIQNDYPNDPTRATNKRIRLFLWIGLTIFVFLVIAYIVESITSYNIAQNIAQNGLPNGLPTDPTHPVMKDFLLATVISLGLFYPFLGAELSLIRSVYKILKHKPKGYVKICYIISSVLAFLSIVFPLLYRARLIKFVNHKSGVDNTISIILLIVWLAFVLSFVLGSIHSRLNIMESVKINKITKKLLQILVCVVIAAGMYAAKSAIDPIIFKNMVATGLSANKQFFEALMQMTGNVVRIYIRLMICFVLIKEPLGITFKNTWYKVLCVPVIYTVILLIPTLIRRIYDAHWQINVNQYYLAMALCLAISVFWIYGRDSIGIKRIFLNPFSAVVILTAFIFLLISLCCPFVSEEVSAKLTTILATTTRIAIDVILICEICVHNYRQKKTAAKDESE